MPHESSTTQPIAVFDSGIGGLTVLKELAHTFPHESFIYLGDTARLPYGSKSPETIRRYAIQNIEYLLKLNPKAIVVACNSASSVINEKTWKGVPIYTVIEPAVKESLRVSGSQRIGIIATRATVASDVYSLEIKKINPHAQVFSVACPLFVPLAEEGWHDDPVTNLIVFRYLQPLLQNQIDTLILGCTHYPLLKNSISRAVGSTANLVDCGESVSQLLKSDFESGKLSKNQGQMQTLTLLLTDGSNLFLNLSSQVLYPLKTDSISIIDL